jgi:hypothetical protein
MADTIREQIIQALITRVEPLSGLAVERCNRSMGETSDRFISVWDGDDQKAGERYGAEQLQFEVAIDVIWQSSDNESVEANAIMGEIETAMRGPGVDRTYGGLATKTDRVRLSPQYSDDGSRYTRVTAIYRIDYQTPTGDPYTVATI